MRQLILAYRRVLVIAIHVGLWATGLVLALLLRFDFQIPERTMQLAIRLVLVSTAIRSLVHWRFGLFHGLWRYSGARDLLSLIKAAALSSVLIATFWAFLGTGNFPRSIFILDFAFSILLIGGLRFGIRTIHEVGKNNAAPPSDGPRTSRRRVLVLGAGDAGETLMREMIRMQRYEPVGFLDDSRRMHGEQIHGVKVLGSIERVEEVVKEHAIDEVILAIPSLRGRQMRRIVDLCRPTGVTLRTVPALGSLIDGTVTVNQLTEVKIEDLLGREPVELEKEAVAEFLGGRVVLVTGAGGSIGSELCHQVAKFSPSHLVLLEQAENSLFEVHRTLLASFPSLRITPYVADICDTKRLEAVFAAERPAVVFHAAAHKHVPMMEANPGEAIKNNVFGTKKVADVAARFDVASFVMVSTDKAVNPTSIMGASKRAAEIYVQALSQRTKTQFVTVRFGNVLGSAGSVIPIFKRQILDGGPVTVTHPEMKRYFMTIPEACQLILQAGTMGRGGEIFILDMGEPVKIVDLARDLIKLSGLRPDEDIPIVFTGMRPGEKLFEELSFDAEKAQKTRHEKVFVGTFKPYPWDEVERGLGDLHSLTDGSSVDAIRGSLARLIPEYVSSESTPSPGRVRDVEPPPAAGSRPSLADLERVSVPAAG